MTDSVSKELWGERLAGGGTWSQVLRRGMVLRVTDPEGDANVGAMLYNARNVTERYNMPDTLKAQHTARITKGNALYSDMGRILCSVVEDTCGWHDPLSGHASAALVAAKYGSRSYQESRNDYYQNARDGFLAELAKYGMGERDLVANLNFFSRVTVDAGGALHLDAGGGQAGRYVELRAEMDTLMILNASQHPLDPGKEYRPRAVELSLRQGEAVGADDAVRNSCTENGRGFVLTERYVA